MPDMKHISVKTIDDPRLRIVVSMFKHSEPMRQNEIVKATGMSPQHVDYHIRDLVSKGVVNQVCDEDSGVKYYMLQEFFYDTTYMEGMAQVLLPLVEAIVESVDVDDTLDTRVSVTENIRYMVNTFIHAIGEEHIPK